MRIEPLNWRRHSQAVLDFQREIYETNFPGFVVDQRFLRNYAYDIRRSLNSDSEGLFVLEEGKRVCGFLWVSLVGTMVDPCLGYIRNVYVIPELRGRGHGRWLLSFAEQWCLQRGVTRVSLDASCCNAEAVGLYRQAGYRTVRLRMEKDLQPACCEGATPLQASQDQDKSAAECPHAWGT